MKKFKPIIVVAGEPNSIFSEIFLKSIKYKKFKSPIILIASYRLIQQQMKKLNIYRKIRLVSLIELKKNHLDNKDINLINVNFSQKKPFDKISSKSNEYINRSFDIAIEIIKKNVPSCIDLLNKSPLETIFLLAKNALGAISNDTGPAHLIASTQCRLHLILSSRSDVKTVIPQSDNVTFNQSDDINNIEPDNVKFFIDKILDDRY